MAMIEHNGLSFTQSHYVTYILNNKMWYKMDDSLVGYIQVMITKYFKLYKPHGFYEIVQKQPIYVYWYTKLPIYGEGHPVSWYLSNREDQILLTYYFDTLRIE